MALIKTSILRSLHEYIWILGLPIPLANNQVRGWYGEWLARRFLKKKKFLILKKNWQSGLDSRREIDLIAQEHECLVFVEVRARSKNALNKGYDSINKKKRKTLLSACRDFLREHSNEFTNYRFDVIEVDLGTTGGTLLHHENVSLFP